MPVVIGCTILGLVIGWWATSRDADINNAPGNAAFGEAVQTAGAVVLSSSLAKIDSLDRFLDARASARRYPVSEIRLEPSSSSENIPRRRFQYQLRNHPSPD